MVTHLHNNPHSFWFSIYTFGLYGDIWRHRLGPTSHVMACWPMAPSNWPNQCWPTHYTGVIMSSTASQITGVRIVYLTVCSDADQRKHQSSASLTFVRGIHQWPVNSPPKGPLTRKRFPFDVYVSIWDICFYHNDTPWWGSGMVIMMKNLEWLFF